MTADRPTPAGITLNGTPGDPTREFTYEAGGLRLTGRVRTDTATPRLAALTATPTAPDGTLTAAQIKGIPTGALLAAVQSHLAAERSPAPDPGPHHPTAGDPLRELAEIYLEETAPGQPRGHLDRIAARLDCPKNTVTTRLSRARKQGWLGPAIKGRAGSDPGPRLIAARHAEQAGIDPTPNETSEDRAAREYRMLGFAERAGSLYDELRAAGREKSADE